jgi:hypothetical protein
MRWKLSVEDWKNWRQRNRIRLFHLVLGAVYLLETYYTILWTKDRTAKPFSRQFSYQKSTPPDAPREQKPSPCYLYRQFNQENLFLRQNSEWWRES